MERYIGYSQKSKLYVCLWYERANRHKTEIILIGKGPDSMVKQTIENKTCYKDGGTVIYKTTEGFTFTRAQTMFTRKKDQRDTLVRPGGKVEILSDMSADETLFPGVVA